MVLVPSLRSALKVAVLWIAFSVALLVNRGPIYFPDTSAYFRVADAAAVSLGAPLSSWSDRFGTILQPKSQQKSEAPLPGDRPTPISGRSIYYGAALLLLGPWLATLFQGLVGSIAVLLSVNRMRPGLPFAALPLIIALSSATVFAALLMPDLLCALAVLACAMVLPHWHNMRWTERIFWIGVLLSGVLSHSATLLIVFAILLMAGVASIWRKSLSVRPVLAAVLLGVTAEIAFTMSVSHVLGTPPLRPPFLSARLIADGPGRDFLRSHCPQKLDFALCSFYERLPSNSDVILWAGDGSGFISMASDQQRAWSHEDARFVSAVLADRPLVVVSSSAIAIARQLAGFRVDDVLMALELPERLPPKERANYEKTLVANSKFPSALWNAFTLPLLIVSAASIALWWRRMSLSALIVIVGIAADIVICGALSTPHDRYLMRIVWMLPIVGLTVVPWRNCVTDCIEQDPIARDCARQALPLTHSHLSATSSRELEA